MFVSFFPCQVVLSQKVNGKNPTFLVEYPSDLRGRPFFAIRASIDILSSLNRLIFLARAGLTSTGLVLPFPWHLLLHGLDHGRGRLSPPCHDPQQEASSQQYQGRSERTKRRRITRTRQLDHHDSLALFLGVARPIFSRSFLLPALFSCRTQDGQKTGNGTAAGMGRAAVQEAYHAKNERKSEE